MNRYPEVVAAVLSPDSSMISQSDAKFTDSMLSQWGSHSFLALSGHSVQSLRKITILFLDLRDRYLGLEGESTEHHLAVEMPEAGASA